MNMLKPALSFGCFVCLLVLGSGCGPSSIVLEHEHAGTASAGGTQNGTPAAETGGSSATSGGSSGGSAAGGTGGALDGGANGGTGGTFAVNCDYVNALRSCNQLGCHSGAYPVAALDLNSDANLVTRLKDVPARYLDIACTPGDGAICDCDSNTFTCITPPSGCPRPGAALLVDSVDYTRSWILAKLENTALMCGDQMPDGGYVRSANDKACIERLVQAIAALP